MKLETETLGDGVVVRVAEDRIDAAVAIQFKDGMREVTRDIAGRVVVDMSNVNFLDSSGLGAVVAARKQIGAGKELELAGLTPTVEKVFHLTRMDSVFTIHPSIDVVMTGEARAS